VSLLDLIRKGPSAITATAMPAISATRHVEGNGAVAGIATVAVATAESLRAEVFASELTPLQPEFEIARIAEIAVAPEGRNPVMDSHLYVESEAEADDDDDRRYCTQCVNLFVNGNCLAARRGELRQHRDMAPMTDVPRRCVAYLPKADEPDQRPGSERWPGLTP